MTSPELDKAEPVRGYCTDCESQTIVHNGRCGCGSGRVIVAPTESATITRLSSELAASRERERALERECEASMVTIAEERCRAEAAEAKVKRLRAETIKECIAVVDAFEDSEAVSALAAVAESKGVKSPGWIRDVMHSHAGELAGKIATAIRALADANTQGGDND